MYPKYYKYFNDDGFDQRNGIYVDNGKCIKKEKIHHLIPYRVWQEYQYNDNKCDLIFRNTTQLPTFFLIELTEAELIEELLRR